MQFTAVHGQPKIAKNDAFLTTNTVDRKNKENDGQAGSPCLDKPVLAQGGGVPTYQPTYPPTHTEWKSSGRMPTVMEH